GARGAVTVVAGHPVFAGHTRAAVAAVTGDVTVGQRIPAVAAGPARAIDAVGAVGSVNAGGGRARAGARRAGRAGRRAAIAITVAGDPVITGSTAGATAAGGRVAHRRGSAGGAFPLLTTVAGVGA